MTRSRTIRSPWHQRRRWLAVQFPRVIEAWDRLTSRVFIPAAGVLACAYAAGLIYAGGL